MSKFFTFIPKKAIACIAALSLLLCTVTPLINVSAGVGDAWDGSIAAQYEAGSGSENDPYIIKTAEQLAKLINDTDTDGKYYKLSENIVINESLSESPEQWYSVAVENGTSAIKGAVFKGSFDGDGHTVSGLYFNGAATDNTYWYAVGLFPRVDSGASIQNVGVINSSITVTGGGAAGSIIGVYSPSSSSDSSYLTVRSCYADSGVSVSASNAGGIAGGINGEAYIYDSYFTGSASTEGIYGLGWSQSVHIYRFYSTVKINKRNNEYFEGNSVYSTVSGGTKVSLEDITGENAVTTLAGFDFAATWAVSDGSTPVLRAFLAEDEAPTGGWSGNIADSYAAGDGSAAAPFEIENAEQLARLVNDTETSGKYYKLTADITVNTSLSNSPKQWYTVASDSVGTAFKGELDGDGHTVSGIYINAVGTGYWFGAGLFPRIDEGAKIRNVGLINSSITVTGSNGMVGAFAGYLLNNRTYATAELRPTVENCYADETVTVSGAKAAGIIGAAVGEMQVKNCYFTGTLSGASKGAVYATHWGNYVMIDYFYSTSAVYLRDANWINGVYSTTAGSNESNPRVEAVIVDLTAITGSDAADTMSDFDFTGTWRTVDGSTPILRVFEGTAIREDGIWAGSVADAYEGGTGTETDPYLIKTAEQLARLVTDTDTSGKYYKLTEDIKLNDTSAENWYEKGGNNEWYSVNNDTATHFNGIFDGDGHTVSGLYYGKTPGRDGYRSGLFPMIGSGAVIRNVGIVDSYLSAFGNVGAISGWSRDNGNGTAPVITGCYADESVTLKGMRVGGMVGAGSLIVSISNCYFTGKIEATENVVGAMTGFFWSSGISISNCYAIGYPMHRSDDSSDANYILKNCYSTVAQSGAIRLSETDMKGTAAKQRSVFEGFDFVSVWNAADGISPTLKVIPANYGIGAVGEVWSGNIAAAYASGSGTKNDPYLIETAAQLAKLIKDNDTKGRYYKLTADILLNDTTDPKWHKNGKSTSANVWYSVNDDKHTQFNGYFEGDGHVVSGIYYNSTPGKDGYRSGLFPMIGSGAVIRNVGVVNSYMSAFANVGAIVGWSNITASGEEQELVTPIISGCYADSTVIIKGMRAGGIIGAGSLPVSIDNCYFTGSLTATSAEEDGKTPIAAGIASYFWSTGSSIVNCYSIDYPLYRTTASANFSVRDCYSNVEQANVKLRTKAQMSGEAAKKNMSDLNWDTIWKTSSSTPVLRKVPEGYQANGYNGKVGELWTGQIATSYAGGSGTESDPYLIATAEQLAKLVSGIVNSKTPDPSGVYYKLTTDIYLNDTDAADWKEEARSWFFSTWAQYEKSMGFRGVLDGDGHVVSGVYLNVDNQGQVLGGLIPVIGEGGVVKNVGVVNSYIRGYDHKHSMGCIGAICGYAYAWEMPADKDGTGHMATVSGCFADSTVTVSGQHAGGIMGATPRAVLIENCYFTGTLLSETDGHKGGIFGYNWSGVIESPIRNCYVATAAKDSAIGKCFDTTKCENVYCTVATVSGGRILSLKSMRGENAIKYMSGFDFDKVWYACSDGTPVLRAFGTTSRYSNKAPFDKICITFVTNGGNELEPIYGEEGEKINWPTVTRQGYEFEGWYVYRELDVEFPLDVFPMNDVTLYAKWRSVSIQQSFENNYDEEKMLGEDHELYKLGVPGFSFDHVHDGLKSVHRIGKTDGKSAFVLFDENTGELIPGREYDITVWVFVESGSSPVELNMYQIDKADISARLTNGVSLAQLDDSKFGQWQQITLRFVAREKYLAIESSGGSSIYFDDILIMPTGNTSDITDSPVSADEQDATEQGGFPWTVVIICVALAVAAALATVIVVAYKKRHSNN